MACVLLENEYLRIEVEEDGAELQSIYAKKMGKELLWHGETAIWPDRAPWLFPVVGQLKNDHFEWKKQSYRLPLHGFAKEKKFHHIKDDKRQIIFELREDESTLEHYPWPFVLQIAYRLKGEPLCVDCEIQNPGHEDMYFSFGAHPGFCCSPGDRLTFTADRKLLCYRLDEKNHLLITEGKLIPSVITLERSLFENDAMLICAPLSQAVTLHRQEGYGIEMSFGKVPWVGIWSKTGFDVPYICIEPWAGVDDPLNADGRIEHKLDIQKLRPGEKFEMRLAIRPFAAK